MMAKKSNYQDIGGPTGHLARLEPFEGNSMRAAWVDGDDTHAPSYVVWSYAEQIAKWSQGDYYVTDDKWSVTTSRHQNLCRAWLGTKAHTHGTTSLHACPEHPDGIFV